MNVILFTTVGCHLCEQALGLLYQFRESHIGAGRGEAADLTIEEVEISESNALMDLYDIKIPVVKRSCSDSELAWPFDLEQLTRFLEQS